MGDKRGTFYKWTAGATPRKASPAHSWLRRVRWACPCNGTSVLPGTPAGPPWWGAHSHQGPARTHLQIAYCGSNKQVNNRPQKGATQSESAARLCHPEGGWAGGFLGEFTTPCLRSRRKNIPTKKSSPEDFLQKLYLVVRVFLCIGFFKESSCIGHRSSINLLGRRGFAEEDPTFSREKPSSPLEGVATCAPITWHPNSLTLQSTHLLSILLAVPQLVNKLKGCIRDQYFTTIQSSVTCPPLLLSPYPNTTSTIIFLIYLKTRLPFTYLIHLSSTSVNSNVWCASFFKLTFK